MSRLAKRISRLLFWLVILGLVVAGEPSVQAQQSSSQLVWFQPPITGRSAGIRSEHPDCNFLHVVGGRAVAHDHDDLFHAHRDCHVLFAHRACTSTGPQ